MKLNKLFKLCASIFCSAAIFAGCQQEELQMPVALEVESQLTFPAIGAEAQYLTVAAGTDESWILDYAEEWLLLEPTSGTGPVEVKVTVEDNVLDGVMQKDRKSIITVKPVHSDNEKHIRKATIHQKGDTYLGAPEYSVTELVGLRNTEEEDKIPAKVKSSKVMAVADEGFVISDGSENILVSGTREVVEGNNVTLNGHKVTVNGLPVFLVEEVLSNDNATEVTYPESNDISAALDSYSASKAEFITVSGTLVDNAVMKIVGATKSMNVYKAAKLSEFNVHQVTISGYYAGIVGGNPSMVVASIKSNGEDAEFGEAFPFNDDFSWLAPFIEQSNAVLAADKQISDCVGEVTSSSNGCANIYTTLVKNNITVLQTLRDRGYVDLNPDMNTIYLQDEYLKFGATDKQSGLRLPFLKIEGTQDIAVSFRWCAQMQASGKIDNIKMVVAITGPGEIDGGKDSEKVPGQFLSPEMNHTQENGQMFWQDASVIVKGATRATSITIRPSDEYFTTAEAPVSSVHRFYLDDISVVNAADAVEATITVEGVENNLITFEGTPEGPATFNVTSDKDFKIQTSAKWFSVDVTEGLGGEIKTVTVTCEPSELSTLRQGTITVKSGTSTHSITVVQSAAGQELDPYIALSTGNNITVLGEGEEFSAKVQTNTTYEVEASDWIEVVETPVTKAKTEWYEHNFKAKVNMTGSARTGYVRFYNETEGIESVLKVEQENFVPRIDVIPAMPFRALSGKGGSMTFTLDANIPYSVSTDASWITLPANQGPSGQIAVPIAFGANDAAAERTANIIFTNPTYEYTKTLTVIQSPAGIILQDDFDWVKPFNEAGGNTAGDTIGSGGLSSGAPNVYTASGYGEAFLKAFAAMGYVDLCPGEQVLYAQDAYLKFGRTGGHNNALEINVPFMKTTDATIDFDFAAMVQGNGTVDDSDLTLVIVGEGTFENGTKYSDELKIVQEKGAYNWTHASAKILGANENTKIRIVMTRILGKSSDGTFDGTYNYNVSGAGRWFLDNLVIK